MMKDATAEWAARVAARNEIEVAKARWSQPMFDWAGGEATTEHTEHTEMEAAE